MSFILLQCCTWLGLGKYLCFVLLATNTAGDVPNSHQVICPEVLLKSQSFVTTNTAEDVLISGQHYQIFGTRIMT